jgi:hypothetical protein
MMTKNVTEMEMAVASSAIVDMTNDAHPPPRRRFEPPRIAFNIEAARV